MERLRDVLEQSRRATDKVTSIVKHTDARLLELQELMGPVQERAQSLSNAHKNLTAVRDETRTWLDHLEAINEAEARVELAFEDEDPDEPTGPDAFLRCVDRVAQAERFFGERRSFEGAEAGWRRAGEILRGCLRACEREFQKLVAAQNRERRESSRRASVPDGKSQTATTETRRSRRARPRRLRRSGRRRGTRASRAKQKTKNPARIADPTRRITIREAPRPRLDPRGGSPRSRGCS